MINIVDFTTQKPTAHCEPLNCTLFHLCMNDRYYHDMSSSADQLVYEEKDPYYYLDLKESADHV